MKHSISESWNRIAAWFQSNAPEVLEQIPPAASREQLDAAAAQMSLDFPDDFKSFYQIADGTDPSGIFPSYDEWDDMAFGPLPLERIVEEWNMQKELLENGDFGGLEPKSSDGIANDWWNVGWIPFADNGGGDYYCVDMTPTDSGLKGQIISHSHESGEHKVLAASLGDYLNELANGLEANAFEYNDDYGICKVKCAT